MAAITTSSYATTQEPRNPWIAEAKDETAPHPSRPYKHFQSILGLLPYLQRQLANVDWCSLGGIDGYHLSFGLSAFKKL